MYGRWLTKYYATVFITDTQIAKLRTDSRHKVSEYTNTEATGGSRVLHFLSIVETHPGVIRRTYGVHA
jgi:hypothetical protein